MYTVCGNIMGGGYTCSDCIDIYVMDDSTIVTPTCNANFYASTSALVGYYIPTGNNYSNTTTHYLANATSYSNAAALWNPEHNCTPQTLHHCHSLALPPRA
jgi:hypothetical protein